MYDEYVENPGFGVLNGLVRPCFKWLVGKLRKRDYAAAQRPDEFVTISEYTRGLIKKYYKREAVVVHPPVEVENFQRGAGLRQKVRCPAGARVSAPPSATSPSSPSIHAEKFSYYVVTSRQVNWKRIDLAVKACVKLKRPLVVIGEGPEHAELVRLAEGAKADDGSPLVRFLPLMRAEELRGWLMGARGYLFPSLEPFGIAPVEALAAGCPVVAFGEGGALDYVEEGVNGVLFSRQTVKSLCEGIEKFEGMKFDKTKVVKSAEKFAAERFEREMREVVSEQMG